MKYDELIGKLRGCEGYRCEDCELRREEFCNLVRMEKAADALEELTMKLHGDEAAIAGMKQQIERMVVNSGNKPKWIPVTDKLPQKCRFYLVTDFGEVEEAYYDSDGFWFSPHGDKLKSVTHWMPLPEPPKEETDG